LIGDGNYHSLHSGKLALSGFIEFQTVRQAVSLSLHLDQELQVSAT
jgi:hypothetical protein